MRRNLMLGGAPLLLAIVLVVVVGGCGAPAPVPVSPCNWPDYMPDGQQHTANALLSEVLLAAQQASDDGTIDPNDWTRISQRVPACRAPDLKNKMGVDVCDVVGPTAYDELVKIRDLALGLRVSPTRKARERWFTLAEELTNFPKGN